MGYRTHPVDNLVLEIGDKTREKSILRLWLAQVSAQVYLVASEKCWNVCYRCNCREGLDIGPK